MSAFFEGAMLVIKKRKHAAVRPLNAARSTRPMFHIG